MDQGWTRATNTGFAYPTTSGRVTALAVDPTSSTTVYLGAAEGGVWKTTNGGSTWTPLTDHQASLAIGSIAIAPSNHSLIYAGTGEEDFSADSYFGLGVLKSTDGGTSWTMLSGPFASSRLDIGSIAVQPTNPNVVLAGTNNGVYRSSNGGSTWTQVLFGAAATSVVFNPTNANMAYAALGSSAGSVKNGVYVSANGGSTWTLHNGSGAGVLPTTHVGRIAIAIAPSTPSTLYAGIANSSNGSLLGLYKTTNGGSAWTKVAVTDYCTPQCWYDDVIAINPRNANTVFVGGSAVNGTLFRSTNGGSSWSEISYGANGVQLHEDHHALAFDKAGATLYVGNDGGVWKTTDVSTSVVDWTNLNNTLDITQFYPGLSVSPDNLRLAYGGTQDNGVQTYGGELPWTYSWCGDGGWTALDFKVTTTVYASCSRLDVEKSTVSGVPGTWSAVTSGISSDRVQYFPPLIMDPSNNETLYFGTYRVYQTTNGASSWHTISSDVTGGGSLTTIAVAPSNVKTIYTGSSSGHVYVTTNAGTGATWREASSGLPAQSITQIAVSPASPSTAYVAFSGFPSGSGHHIYKTTNSGTSWTDISVRLPNTPVNDLAVDPTYSNTLYAATDIWVFYTTNGGSTWMTLGSGLPNVVVTGLKMYKSNRTLWAGTHGRGVWSMSLSSIQ